MKQSVTFYSFHRAFETQRPNNFSYEALGNLFDYFENLESDLGEEIELDVIAICCDYSEESAESICKNYDIDLEIDGKELAELNAAISALPAATAENYYNRLSWDSMRIVANNSGEGRICRAIMACLDAEIDFQAWLDFDQDEYEEAAFEAAYEALEESGKFSALIKNESEKTVTYAE